MRDSLDHAGESSEVHWAPLCSRRATTQDPRAVAAASAAYALIKVDLASDQLVVPSHVRAADVAQWQQNRRPKRRYLGAGSAFSPSASAPAMKALRTVTTPMQTVLTTAVVSSATIARMQSVQMLMLQLGRD